jgi:hypothetical protein
MRHLHGGVYAPDLSRGVGRGSALNRVVSNPHSSLPHRFKATNDNAETRLLGMANPQYAPLALL